MTEEQFRVLSAAQDFVSDLLINKLDKAHPFSHITAYTGSIGRK
jgi:hypothetical protein